MLSTTLAATDTHRSIPSAKKWIPVADAFSGPPEGRPRSSATIRNYCLYLRQLRSYALQRVLRGWEQITRAHIRAFLAQRRQETSSASATVAYYALKSFFRYLESEELEGTEYRSPLASRSQGR